MSHFQQTDKRVMALASLVGKKTRQTRQNRNLERHQTFLKSLSVLNNANFGSYYFKQSQLSHNWNSFGYGEVRFNMKYLQAPR